MTPSDADPNLEDPDGLAEDEDPDGVDAGPEPWAKTSSGDADEL